MTNQFLSLAESLSKAQGYPDLPKVVMPHPFDQLPKETVEQLAEERIEEIVSHVVKPQQAVARA